MTTSENFQTIPAQNLVVEMRGVVKEFPGVIANDHVDFDLNLGEIHALLGENGAGKSTLMNILAGLYQQDSGVLKIKNNPVNFTSPRDAINYGIGMVHQHFMLVPSQTVTENILLGLKEPRFRLNLSKYENRVAELGEQYGLKVEPGAKIWQLSVGEQQRVEILKMLYRGADIFIMDEPTAVLAPSEIEQLFTNLKEMTKQGKSIIFISHKLQEVMSISDRITVLQKGKVTATGIETKETTRRELAKLMVGRDVEFHLDKVEQKPGEVVLSIENVHTLNDKGLKALNGVTLELRAGEILGLAGVAGNGQRELAQVISGLRQCTQGQVLLNDIKISNKTTRLGIDHGLAYIPEDRTHVGSSPNLSVTDNVIMKSYRKPPIGKGMSIDSVAASDHAEELKQTYEISVPTIETPVRLLSGGNLQRVILAREISGQPSVMIAMQPTRGLDVGAIEGVQKLILAQRENGEAILLVSEEIEELLALSDRIAVIYEGEIMGIIQDGDIEIIGQMMTGMKLEELRGVEDNV